MKKLFYLIGIFSMTCFAQKELWGVNSGDEYISEQPNVYFGNITKYDINGENPVIMHEFNGVQGKIPKGKLFLASNGKLYGTTLFGGNISNAGVLFEYDLILNKYRVVKYFENNPNTGINPKIGVLEPITGQLYGATSDRIYKYNIAAETITFYNNIGFFNNITSELMKASDGNLYGVSIYSTCPTFNFNQPWNGCVIKFNMTTNTLSIIHPLDCNFYNEGTIPSSQLIEVSPGKLLGLNKDGGLNLSINPFVPAGTLFEFNINTNTFTKKIDFSRTLTGNYPNTIIDGGNGKIYGLCEEGGVPPGNTSTDLSDFRGTLFEYTPATNVLEVKQYFGTTVGNYVRYPTSLIKTSLGHYVGTIPNASLFKWNETTNVISHPDYSNIDPNLINAFNNSNLIEICRKPSYQEFTPNTFNPCVNTPFTYDIQNTNATSYVWKKDGVIVPLQTTGILTINNLIASDTGVYTCTMTNECGTTTTMNLNVNVNCLDNETFVKDKNEIVLYPNPTKNTISIHLPENKNYQIENITITNLLGQNVIENSKNIKNIDVSSLQKGIYIVELKTDKVSWNGKFVKD